MYPRQSEPHTIRGFFSWVIPPGGKGRLLGGGAQRFGQAGSRVPKMAEIHGFS